ncbi:Gfo/Idh/MocA family oxidoreductase [Candidatus Peregrinibacteria bacterium]|nr:Gfo/Idh/MocA family oxidoreductase [Candidatus Peregrinibacteria bacterium]
MNKTLKFGVIGLGFGAQIHVPALKSLKGVNVAAVLGKNEAKTREIAAKLKIPTACCTFRDFFRQKLDAVSIALPPDQSGKAICMALKHGLPVLAEKPLTISYKNAKYLMKLAKGRITAIDFQFPELDVFKKLKNLIESKRFGSIRHVQIMWMVESRSHKNKIWSWKTDANLHGGVVTLLGSHLLYLIEWFFGPVNGLYAHMSSKSAVLFAPKNKVPAEDLVNIIFNHPKISCIAASVSNAAPSGIGHLWEINCDKGTIVLHNPTNDYMNGFVLKIRTAKGEKTISEQKKIDFSDGRLAPFRSLAKRFVEAIKTGKPMAPDFKSGARVQFLMEALYASARPSPAERDEAKQLMPRQGGATFASGKHIKV